MKKSVEQQAKELGKTLRGINGKLTEKDKMQLAVAVPMALSTLRLYLSGNIAKIHSAESIIEKYNELFQLQKAS